MTEDLYMTDRSGENQLAYERRKAALSPMGTITISISPDTSGIILDVDPMVMKFFGYLKRSQLVGKPIEILLPRAREELVRTDKEKEMDLEAEKGGKYDGSLRDVHRGRRTVWTDHPESVAMGNRARERAVVGLTKQGTRVFPLLAVRFMPFKPEEAIYFDEDNKPILETGVGFLIDPADFASQEGHGGGDV